MRTQDGRSPAAAYLQLMRPKQWAKNSLVVAAPAAAGVLSEAGSLARTVLAFVALTLASAGTYALNDAGDAQADAIHPKKRNRPVASGRISPQAARAFGVGLLVASLLVAAGSGRWQLVVTVAAYVVLTTLYSTVLKHIAVLDLVAVSAGFVLRAIAGATATGVDISEWFLIVASFGSLFMVAGKRASEFDRAGEDASAQRRVLAQYTASYLAQLRTVACGLTLLSYTLFAFEKSDVVGTGGTWFDLSILPFAIAILRYGLLLDRGLGEAPEELVLGDRQLQAAGAVWAATFMIGVYAA